MEKPRVLVVEDDPDVLSIMAEVLEERYQVATAPDGETALRLIGSVTVDVVLADIRMPGVNGFDVLEAVQSRVPSAAVVLMTGYASVPDAVAAIKLGAFDYLEKPLDLDEISLVVTRALEHKDELEQGGHQEASAGGDGRHEPAKVSSGFHPAVEEARDGAS